MLNVATLELNIKQAFDEVFPPAFERAMLEMMPQKSDDGDKKAKNFAQTVTDLIAGDMASRLASAIDYYVRNANVYGSILTVGSPYVHTAVLTTIPVGTGGGSIPNMLGIM